VGLDYWHLHTCGDASALTSRGAEQSPTVRLVYCFARVATNKSYDQRPLASLGLGGASYQYSLPAICNSPCVDQGREAGNRRIRLYAQSDHSHLFTCLDRVYARS
jgi:hypothetical protein